jgi:hypothetical protein
MSTENPFDSMDQDIRSAVEGLIYLGELEEEVEFCGHTFGLKTLRAYEEMAAASVVEKFRNTLKEPEAWAAAQVGLALTHIDGETDFCPSIGPDSSAFAKARFNYISRKWYWPTIQFLYNEYTRIQGKQLGAIRAVQDLSNRSLPTSSSSADSSEKQDTSSGEMEADTHGSEF